MCRRVPVFGGSRGYPRSDRPEVARRVALGVVKDEMDVESVVVYEPLGS